MRLHWTLLASAVMAALELAGCVRFQPQTLSATQTANDFDRRTLTDPELTKFREKNLGSSGTEFDLPNLALAAFFYHPDMDVARAKWAGSNAAIKTAGESPNPTLNVAPGYNSTTTIPTPWIVSSVLDIPVETAGKRGYRIAQASSLSEAARQNLAAAAWTVRSRVRQRLLDLYASMETETLLGAQQALQAQTLGMSEAQFEAGAISSYERTQARIAAQSVRFALRDAERQRAEARVLLADAIGIPVHALDQVKLSFAGFDDLPPEIPPSAARREALFRRPDILAALAEYAASQSALQLEIAKQYPDIHLSPGYEFDQGDNKWTLGLGVTLPIFNRNHGAISEANARRSEAAANFIAVQARAIGEIDRATASYEAALQKAGDADALRENLRNQENSLRAMLEAGEISKADMTGVQLQLASAALTRLDALVKAQQARGLLEDAMQQSSQWTPTLWETAPRIEDKLVTHP